MAQSMNQTDNHSATIAKTVEMLSDESSLIGMCHFKCGEEPLPSLTQIKEIIEICRSLLFPGFFGNDDITAESLKYVIGVKCSRLHSLLVNQIAAGLAIDGKNFVKKSLAETSDEIAAKFIALLPEMRRVLHTDVLAIYRGDPAAESCEEVIFCYPSIRAISNYRIAHALLKLGVPVIPRMISEMAHSETGIDIHPGAEIGEYFAIDHGTGIVIGATAIIGNNVKLYQGVTLGARSFDYDDDNNPIKGIPRHPIIGDNVIIYSNTSVLGRIKIGKNAIIGGNIWLTDDVAENEKLTQAKAKNNILRFKQEDK